MMISGGKMISRGKLDISAVNDATLSASGTAKNAGLVSKGSTSANNDHTRTVTITITGCSIRRMT